MKKLFFVFSLILAGFIFSTAAHAATVANYTPATTTINTVGLAGNATANTYNGFIFQLPATALVSSVTLITPSSQANSSPNSMTWAFIDTSGTVVASTTSTNIVSSFLEEYTVTFGTPVTLTAGTYFFGSHYNSGVGVVMGYQSAGLYAGGCNYSNELAGTAFTITSCSSPSDIYFKVNSGNGNYINITYPTNGSSGLENFGLWRLTYQISTTTSQAWLDIYVNTTSTVSAGNYLWFDQEFRGGTAGYYDTVMNRLDPQTGSGYASGTTYYAKAYLYSSNGQLASSDVVSFSIGNVSVAQTFPTFNNPFLAQTSSSTDIFREKLRNKAPLAFLYDIVDIINSAQTSSTNSFPTIVLKPFPASSSLYTALTIVSSSSFTYVGSSNLQLVRDIIGYLFWAGFLSLVYFQVKRMFHRQ